MNRSAIPPALDADFTDVHIEAVGGMIDAAGATLRAAALCALPPETVGQSIAPEMSLDSVIDCALACSARGAEMHAVALLHTARLRLGSESVAIRILCRLLSSRALHLAASWTDIVLPGILTDTTRQKMVGLTRRESLRQLAAQTRIHSPDDATQACERFKALAELLRYTDIRLRILRVHTSSTSPRAEPFAEVIAATHWLTPTPPLTVAPDGTPAPNRHFDLRVSSGNFTRFRDATLIGSYPTLYFDDHLVDDWITRYADPSEFTPYIEDDRSYYLKLLHYFKADDEGPQAIAVIPTAQRRLPRAILLNGPYQWNYYHWLCEYLTLIPAINALPATYRDWPLLVSRDAFLHPNLVEALRLAMAPCPRRLEIVDQDETLSVDELIVPPRYSWLKPCLQTRAHIDARDRMLAAPALHALHDQIAVRATNPATRRLFMVRTSKTRITNQDEAIALFIRHGFEVVTPECLSFDEAQRLFAQASIITGPPGAAFANLLLCPKTATAIVLMPDIGPEAPYFGAIGGSLGQRVIHLCGPSVDRSDYNSPFACDLALAERLLTQIGPPPSAPTEEHGADAPADDQQRLDNETNPLVTIVIPAEKPRWFERALVSALGQTHPQIEVEVIDRSPDTRIRDICRRYPRVRHHQADSPEHAATYRQHLHRTRAPYVMLLRDHDLLEPECVAELLAALRETPDAALAFSRHGLIDPQDTALRPEARRSGPPERTTLAGDALSLALLRGQRPPGVALSAILLDGKAMRTLPQDTSETLSAQGEHAYAFLYAAAGRPVAYVDARLVSLRVCDRARRAHTQQELLERHAMLKAAHAEEAWAARPEKELADARQAYNQSLLLALPPPGDEDDDTLLDTLFAAETLPEHNEYLVCRELAATGRAAQALPRLVACLEAQSVHWRLHDLLADLAADAGDAALALAYRQRAWQLAGQRGAEHLKYAQELLDSGQETQAMAILLRLRQRDPLALSGLDLNQHVDHSDPSPQPLPCANAPADALPAGLACHHETTPLTSSPQPDAMPRTTSPLAPAADTRATLCSDPGAPLVSILIPAYKPRWFELALRSALAQDYPNLEILVFDNCPNEDIRAICSRYPLVTYYRNPNMGPQNSLDIASASRGRYVKHLFDDDLLEPDCVSALVEAIERAPDSLIAFGASWTIDENDRRTGLRQDIETPEVVHLYDGNAICRAFATTCANMIGEYTSVLMDGHWLREDVLRLRRAEALNRELFGLCDVICFMNAAAGRPVAFVNRPLTSFRINSESNSNPERNPAFIEAITDWREIIAEAETRGLLSPDERGTARNSYNLRATGMGQTFPSLCAAIAPTLFAPTELPTHAAFEASLALIDAGRSDEAAPGLIAMAEGQSAHPGVFATLAELALGSGELAVAARFNERAVSLQAYPLSACAQHLAFLEKHGLQEAATAFRADTLRRHPEAPDLISPMPTTGRADDPQPTDRKPSTTPPPETDLPVLYQRWQLRRTQGGLQADDYQRRVAKHWKRQPLFDIVLVVGADEETLLADSIDALASQYYTGWRLSIFAPFASPEADFLSPQSPVRWFAQSDINDADKLAAAVNHHLAASPADWIGCFACGTRLLPEALLTVGDYIAQHPDWRMIYSDEDALTADGQGESPQFKPDFNLELLRATDYIGGIFIRRDAMQKVGGYAHAPGGETYDLTLRLVDQFGESAVGHIPEILQRLPSNARSRSTDQAAQHALAGHLQRIGVAADILPGLIEGRSRRILYRHSENPLISIVIPTNNRLDLLGPCIESLLTHTAYPNWELLVVDNGNPNPATTSYFNTLRSMLPNRVHVLAEPGEFDFSRLNNRAAEFARGEYLLLLNDDTQCIHDDWLDALLAQAQRTDVGIVGARLLYPDTLRVQHAGIILGMSGSAGHVFAGQDYETPGYLDRTLLDQEYSAVTGACLLIRRALYRDLGGLDGEHFKVSYNDVDLCLRVRERGLKIIYTPHATLLHHGSASQKSKPPTPEKIAVFQREAENFIARWRPRLITDPAWNRHLSLSDTTPRIEAEIVPAWNQDFHDRPRILVMPSPSEGAAEYRNIAPLRALHNAGRVHFAATCQPKVNFERAPSPIELARASPDTLLMHAAVDNVRGLALQQYRRLNPEVMRIFSLDDLITDIPQDNPTAAHLPPAIVGERLRLGLAASDRLIVSTEPLLEAYRQWIDDIRLIPNRLAADRWGSVRSQRRYGARARVGWAGAQQHAGDLRFVLEVVRATHTEVDWIFFGMLPEGAEPYVAEFHAYEHNIAAYPEKLARLDLDLAIAPLEIHAFNEAKSNLRLLEYGILGWPVICTDILPYRTNNPPVWCLPNETERWVATIRECVAERDALAHRGDELQNWVRRHYLLESHLDEWYAALTR